MNVALLVNPVARGGADLGVAHRAVELLRERGVRTSVISGGSASESTDLLRAALGLGVDAVVVAGGDGTVSLAIQELAGTETPLGIVPCGTGNDFAGTLGIRERDASAAVAAITTGAVRPIDLGRVTRADGSSAYFGSVLASGFDSKVNDRANAMRWPRGASRYNIAILVEFLRLAGIPYEVEATLADGTTERFDEDLVMATVGNGRMYGGGIPICPDAVIDDRLLDLVLVRPTGRARLATLLPRLYKGTHTNAPEVLTRRVRAVRLSARGVTAYADGDPLGALPLTVEVAPLALRVFAPQDA